MKEKDFMEFAKMLDEYLCTEKVFVENAERLAEVEHASNIASKLFKTATIKLRDGALQNGSIVVCIESFDFIVRGIEEIELFKELISKADNFEIYAKDDGNIFMSFMFQGALSRIKP